MFTPFEREDSTIQNTRLYTIQQKTTQSLETKGHLVL